MNDLNTIIILKTIILVLGCFAILFFMKKEKSWIQTGLFLALIAGSLFVYTKLGKVQKIYPIDYNERKKVEKTVLFQWHEIWHYYAGSKYFKELGYYGLYDTYVLADFETKHMDIPHLRVDNIRNLRNTHDYYSKQNAIENARALYRPRFSNQRWNEFKKDYVFMQSIAGDRWADHGVWDVGFNTPPTWSLIGSSITNILPLSKPISTNILPLSEPISRNTPYSQALIFPWFDVVLLLLAGFFLYKSFGLPGLAGFFILYGTSFISDMSWNSGSFLRYMWLFGLTAGVCMLKDKKYFKAGLFLGFSTCCRAFPLMFLIGASLHLFVQGFPEKNWKPLLQLIKGAAFIGGAFFVLGLLFFGWSAYQEFFDMIFKHKEIIFIQNIGYRKIAVFGDWMRAPIHFMWEDGLYNFRDWNLRSIEIWQDIKLLHYLIFFVLLGCVINAMRYIKAHEATILCGVLFLFFTQQLTCYYYVFVALIPVVALAQERKDYIRSVVTICGMFAMWIYIAWTPYTTKGHGIVINYYICIAIFLFLLTWIGACNAEAVPQLVHWVKSRWKGKTPVNRVGVRSTQQPTIS